MGELVRIGDLEIDQDLAAQEREWKASRIARVLAALVLLAGLTGLLGHGPLARAHQGEPGSGLEVEYSRFAHYQDPERLRLRARPDHAGRLRLWIARTSLEALDLEGIDPPPLRIESAEDRNVIVFDAGDARELELELRFQYETCGSVELRLGLDGGPELRLRPFVYP